MPVEFIGIAHTRDHSETNALPPAPPSSPTTCTDSPGSTSSPASTGCSSRTAQSMPDGFTVASQILNATERLGVLLAHRPGFVAPTVAARKYATIDAFHPRPDRPARDFRRRRRGPGPRRRLLRQADAVPAHRRVPRHRASASGSPPQRFDYEGEFYQVKGALSAVVRPEAAPADLLRRRVRRTRSGVGGRHADVYAFWGEPLDGIRQRIIRRSRPPPRRRTAARSTGSRVSLRPDRRRHRGGRLGARQRDPRAHPGAGRRLRRTARAPLGSEGSQRLLRYAAAGGPARQAAVDRAVARPPAPRATPPPSSAATSRSPSRCSTTWPSAPARC